MIRFRCGRCTEWLGAPETAAGQAVTCHRCGHLSLCPEIAVTRLPARAVQSAAPVRAARVWLALGAGAILATVVVWGAVGWGAMTPPRVPISPAEARQQALLKENIDLPGDPELVRAYHSINIRHFAGALPEITVRWEPALADVGALASEAFTLEGMFGRLGGKQMILLNPSVKADRRAFDRALCHEMAHLYLFTTGNPSTNHGLAFKAVLERLSKEGAFEGIAGSDGEKSELRAWIDAESKRIDVDRQDLEILGREIERARGELEGDFEALNERMAASAAPDRRPTADEVQAVEAKRARFHQMVAEANARIERSRATLARFNEEVARYNLMVVYPDGIDEEGLVPAKRPH